MTWTYSGDPSSSVKDEIRYLVADTDTNHQLTSDEEIAYAIVQNSDVYGAAVIVARAIATAMGREVDKQVGDLKISKGKRAANYLEVLRRLEETAAIRGAKVFAGGISKSDKEATEADADRVVPTFTTGMMSNLDP